MSVESARRLAALALVTFFALGSTTPVAAARAEAGTAVVLASAASTARPTSDAESFVRSSIDKGTAILSDPSLSKDERRTRFREFLFSITDMKRIALFTLGPYAQTAPQPDIDEFVAAYARFMAGLYQGYFDSYRDQTLRVTNAVARREDDTIVSADVLGSNGAPQLKIAFRVRKGEGRNIITDLQIEGAWLVLNQRADFTSYLQRHGGKLAALASELEIRTRRMSGEMIAAAP